MLNPNHKKAIKLIGVILTLISIYFLSMSLVENFEKVIDSFSNRLFIVILIIGLVIYGLTLVIVVMSWSLQLKERYPDITFKQLFKIAGTSQVGKYLPGNVFHIASRFYMARKINISSKDITNTLINETLLIVISAMIVGSVYLYYYLSAINLDFRFSWLLLTIPITLFIFYKVNPKDNFLHLLSGNKLFIIIGIFLISHGLLGGIVFLQYKLLFSGQTTYLIITSMLALSFVVGFITPGSPGGIGIREFVFLKLASVVMDESIALTLIITLRLISVSGDLLMYFIAAGIDNKTPEGIE